MTVRESGGGGGGGLSDSEGTWSEEGVTVTMRGLRRE